MSRVIHDNSDPALQEEQFEQAAELLDLSELEVQRDLATEESYDTKHGDGHTYNPDEAWEQGLTYTPPYDPPVLPSDDPQGVEIAAGFAPSMEENNSADAEVLPGRVDNNDDELENDVLLMLRNTSETQHLTDITVRARDGVVTLLGTVQDDNDLALVDEIVNDMPGVAEVINRLDTEM